jgi:conjugal transfer/type IV secretion protein DotA/TraY
MLRIPSPIKQIRLAWSVSRARAAHWHGRLRFVAFFASILLLTLCVAEPGFAQSAGSTGAMTTSTLTSATPSTDQSMYILKYIFGNFATNPFTSAGSSSAGSLLGSLFLYLNSFVFLISSLWTTYTILSGVISTAHEGEFLGKRYSTVWYPIRLVWGAATLVPVFGGFSLGQGIYMFMAILSIGCANLMTNVGIQSTANFTQMVSAPSGMPAASLVDSSIADDMFMMWLCADTLSAQPDNQPDSVLQSTPLGSNSDGFAEDIAAGGTGVLIQNVGVQIGTASQPDECGSAGVSLTNSTASIGANSGIFSGLNFNVASVNYQGIAQAIQSSVQSAHQSAMTTLSSSMQSAATTWYQSYLSAKNAGSGASSEIIPYPLSAIEAARTAYDQSVSQSITSAAQNSGVSTLTSSAISNMQQTGWVGLGMWYETFAEVNRAISEAAHVNFTFTQPTADDSAWLEVQAAALKARSMAFASGQDPSGGENNTVSAKAIGYIQKILCDNATGNVSVGQCLLRGMQWLTFQNTGGTNLVNPIIAAKNLGDVLMVSGESLWGVGALAAAESQGLSQTLEAKVVDAVSGQATALSALIQAAVKMVMSFASLLFYLGLVLSIYVPLIPFISWFSALMTWVAVILEAIISAPLWSLVHGEGEGEGMGQRTQHGYLFLLNVTLRAPLMVIAFFLASAMTVIMGTLLYSMFGPAVANAAGNSIVGLFTIVGYLVALTGLMIIVVQTSFNLIHVIPDQVLGWVGNGLGAHLGREVEGRIHGMFVSGGRNLQGGLTAAVKQDRKPGAPGAGGGAGGGAGAQPARQGD